MNRIEIRLGIARQIGVWRAVGSEGSDVPIILQSNERLFEQIALGFLASPKSVVVEEESVKLCHPRGGLCLKKIFVQVYRQIVRVDLLHLEDISQKREKV